MGKKREHRQYDRDFKIEAVRLYIEGDRTDRIRRVIGRSSRSAMLDPSRDKGYICLHCLDSSERTDGPRPDLHRHR